MNNKHFQEPMSLFNTVLAKLDMNIYKRKIYKEVWKYMLNSASTH